MRSGAGLSILVLSVFTLTAGSGCAHRGGERHEARVEGRHDSGPDRHKDWTKLGERWVDGARDRDVIEIGRRDGRFRRIMIVVEHSALEMFDVVVRFEDGSHFSPPTRHVFSADTRSHVIDLPGGARVLRSVEFRYGNLPGGGRAQAELWAQ